MNFNIYYFVIILASIQLTIYNEVSSQKISIVVDFKEKSKDKSLMIDAQEFLWHVAVVKEEETGFNFVCSGTIIHSRFVITAANCVADTLPSELKVLAGLNVLHHFMDTIDSPHSIYSVSEKFYPHNSHQFDTNEFAEEHGVVVLKLERNVGYTSPQLTAIPSTGHLSTDCFVIGWGVLEDNSHHQENKCSKQSMQNVVNSILQLPRRMSPQIKSLLHIRNRFGLSSMFIFKLSTMFNAFSDLIRHDNSKFRNSEELTCSADYHAHLKAVEVTASHHYKCLCPTVSQLCLYSKYGVNLINQIDIGSPIFCKVQRPKFGRKCIREPVIKNNFGLAGIITSKHIQMVPLLQQHSHISIMRASNITNFSDFIIAVLQREG
ncbi:hypothetical protein J6590_035083 [Homalodisca vitripennis]|nr:hypothetical protein J6590_035083 [Homalodisca vitripennis]